ncbi:MAG: type II toxin-antitoxin system HicA family toxin [Alphaproteobacteria bacterium]|nr:type II toxin-antitoxin system HicA family toxin [Alphaproteobacteria bacterium]MCZ6849067.1 type II toxin-antitoxin system HicA family toxin [Alphaproteobacteria bacterium]
MGGIELALRERLEMAGCYATGRDDDGRESWFTPHLNGCFALPRAIATADAANAVLRSAGMEEAF